MTHPMQVLFICSFFTFSTRLRDILSTELDQERNDDLLLTPPSAIGNRRPPALPFNSNTSRPYWQPPVTSMNHGFETASMQRQYNHPYYPSMNTNSTGTMTKLRWNNGTFYTPNGKYPHPAHSNGQRKNSFFGPDGTLQLSICDHPNGFLRWQKNLCRQYLHLMKSVIQGYLMGLRECEYQFSAHRWNCQGHNVTMTIEKRHRRRRRRMRQSRLSSRTPQGNSRRQKRIKTYLDKLLSKGLL